MRALILNFTMLFTLAVAVAEECSINEKACTTKGSVMLQAKLSEQNATDVLEVHPQEILDAAAAQAQMDGESAPEGLDAIAQSFLVEFAAFQQGKKTNTREDCIDDLSFMDEKGRLCSAWDGYPCEEATATWSYTAEGQAKLLSSCKNTCGTCKGQCGDVPDFQDAKGHACTKWRGYNCIDAAELWSYSNEEEDNLIKNCAKSCKKCEWHQEEKYEKDEMNTEEEEHFEEEMHEHEEGEEEEEQREEDDDLEKEKDEDSQYGDDSQYGGDSLYEETTVTTTSAASSQCLCGTLNYYRDLKIPGTKGWTCAKPGLMQWACSKGSEEKHKHWLKTLCCGTKTPEEMQEYQKMVANGSCLCGADNFYDGLEVPNSQGGKCGAEMNSWMCALKPSDSGRKYLTSHCCGKQTLEEKRKSMESIADGSCLCGSKNFYKGLAIPHWQGRTCGAEETSWACPRDGSDPGRKYLADQCCGDHTLAERQEFLRSIEDGTCLCGNSLPFNQGKEIPHWAGRTCGKQENNWACKRKDTDPGRRYLARQCCKSQDQ